MTPTATADRILLLLKSRGAMSTAALAAALHTTTEAVRQQVRKLVEAALVRGVAEAPAGVGRPGQAWSLSARGHARFPDRHAELTRQLVDTGREVFGEAGLEHLIARREEHLIAGARRCVYRITPATDAAPKMGDTAP